MPGVQLVNMRPNVPVSQTKTVATVSPRVVISNPHMVASRPTNPGVSSHIPLLFIPRPKWNSHFIIKLQLHFSLN